MSHKLSHLGVPHFVAFGNHKDNEYRFLVMPKFGTDLQKLFEDNGKLFPTGTVYNLAIQMVCFELVIPLCGHVTILLNVFLHSLMLWSTFTKTHTPMQISRLQIYFWILPIR
jgi:hypothetical protein